MAAVTACSLSKSTALFVAASSFSSSKPPVSRPFVVAIKTSSSFSLQERRLCRFSSSSSSSPPQGFVSETKEDEKPKPTVNIDEHSDPDATIVEICFGDRLGALLDTMKALKDLGLNVVRGVVTTEGPNLRKKKFLVTRMDNNKKVENPELLELIRLTIIRNLLEYHPESSEQLALGEAFGIKPPAKKLDVDVATHISVSRDGSRRLSALKSLLYLLSVETADRPGLLLEIMRVISDSSVYVDSAEIDTQGLVAKDKFWVTYHGEALSPSLEEVLTNSLRYYLRRPETEEDSY
ncbi:unnamed protein product [Sphagnum troendelagicum]|uniref:ACT domain-containing protein n=1 Tax=Sphagnum troendelagicum TaxID=128251 RepID=A0ABP0TL42_9BRYO